MPNYDTQNRKDLEEAVLGSILIDSDRGLKEIVLKHGLDQPEFFIEEMHQKIFYCILRCWENNEKVDLISITKYKYEKVKSNSADSKLFDLKSIQVSQRISSSAHIEFHILILKQYIMFDYWNKRADEIINSDWNDRDIFEVSNNIIDGYKEIENKFVNGITQSGNDILEIQRKKFEKIQKGEYFTIPTSIDEFDEFTGGGWHPAELTIIAGRPGMGKTSITMAIAKKASFKNNNKGLFLSLEMTKLQLINRVLAPDLGISYQKIKSLNLSQEEFNKLQDGYKWFFEHSPLRVFDRTDAATLYKIIELVKKEKPAFIVIDYLQLIELTNESVRGKVTNREQEISTISRGLKALATELDIPVIALSQLSRAVELRSNKRPMLSDLRESGSLEQDADNVIFYYRDAYYKKMNGQVVPEKEEGNFEMNLAKGREYGTKKFDCHIDFKTNEISNSTLFEHQDYGPKKPISQPPPPPLPPNK